MVHLVDHDDDEFYLHDDMVLKELITDYSFDYDSDKYLKKREELWNFYKEQAKEIDKAYLRGEVNHYKIPNN